MTLNNYTLVKGSVAYAGVDNAIKNLNFARTPDKVELTIYDILNSKCTDEEKLLSLVRIANLAKSYKNIEDGYNKALPRISEFIGQVDYL